MNTKIIQGKERFYNIYQKNKKGVDKKMNEIEIYTKNLPTTIEDVSKFVLFGREKLTSIRAEIRAIDKLQIAEEVRNQKKEEAQLLAEALLDAEVKLGELFQALPKAQGFSSDKARVNKSAISNTTVTNGKIDKPSNTTVTKLEQAQELGFDKMTVSRFETLAKNKDLVEQVKQEARENDDIPTRTQVLSLAKARKQMQEQKEEEYKEFCINSEKGKKLFNQLVDSLGFIRRLKSEDIELSMMSLDNNLSKAIIGYIQEVQVKLALLKQEAEKYRGVKIWEENEC